MTRQIDLFGDAPAPAQVIQQRPEISSAAKTLRAARQRGAELAELAAKAAAAEDPLFAERARAHILEVLKAGPAWGEDLVDACTAVGIKTARPRAYGAVFMVLSSRDKLIRCVEIGLRRKGHGTAGSRRWELVA